MRIKTAIELASKFRENGVSVNVLLDKGIGRRWSMRILRVLERLFLSGADEV